MPLPSSGPISMSQVNTEIGYSSSATISLNDTNVRTLAGVGSGSISMSNLLGKSWIVNVPTSLVIFSGGGGGGGLFMAPNGYYYSGGGGGGGSIVRSQPTLTSQTDYVITIGAGGAGSAYGWYYGSSGGNTVAFGFTDVLGGQGGISGDEQTFGSSSYTGGRGGGSLLWPTASGNNGGSGLGNNGGGGASRGVAPGGGANVGGDATYSKGGDGAYGYDLSTTPGMTGYSPEQFRVAGGGGGGVAYGSPGGTGNAGGGGGGGGGGSNYGFSGSYGGGGGGGGLWTGYPNYGGDPQNGYGGNGGSGYLIIQYSKSYPAASYTGSWVLSTSNSDTSMYTYLLTSSGTFRIG